MVGLFILMINSTSIKRNYQSLERNAAIASIETIANMPELNCDSSQTLCLDEDKLIVFTSHSNSYENFWPVASINLTKIVPGVSTQKRCPGLNCTYYEIYNSNQASVQQYATFVSICKKVNPYGGAYDECSIGKFNVGIIVKES